MDQQIHHTLNKQLINELVRLGAEVIVIDPIAVDNAKKLLAAEVTYSTTVYEALELADVAVVLTEWDEVKNIDLSKLQELMKEAVLFDGRNCFDLEKIKKSKVEYYSVGRPSVKRELINQ